MRKIKYLNIEIYQQENKICKTAPNVRESDSLSKTMDTKI